LIDKKNFVSNTEKKLILFGAENIKKTTSLLISFREYFSFLSGGKIVNP